MQSKLTPCPQHFLCWIIETCLHQMFSKYHFYSNNLSCCPSWRVPVLASTFTLMQNKVCWFFSLPSNLVCNNGKQPLKHTRFFLTQCHLTTSVWMRKYTFPTTNKKIYPACNHLLSSASN